MEDDFRARLLACRPLDLRAHLPFLRRRLPQLAALAEATTGAGRENALEHTQRVLDATRPHLQELPAGAARALYLAALLHEVGRGRVVEAEAIAAGHERASAARAREILHRLQIPPELRDQVVYLVRMHAMPLTYGRRPLRSNRLLRLAWTLDTQLLYLLARADCEAVGRSEARCRAVAAFRARCQELGLFGRQPPPLLPADLWAQRAPADPRLRRRLAGEGRLRRIKGALDTPADAQAWLAGPQPAPAGTLYLPVGVPGSGKSTWVRAQLPGATVISMDELRERLLGSRSDQSRNQEIFMRARAALGRALRAHETAVWDAQSHTWGARQSLLSLAREAHAYVVIIYFDVPLAVALERNQRREAVVPIGVIRHSYRDLEEPRPFEAEEVWRIAVDGQCTRAVWPESVGP